MTYKTPFKTKSKSIYADTTGKKPVMEVLNAGKQTKAFWRSEQRLKAKWFAEEPITAPEKAYGQYARTCERLQGHAAGWIAGVAWAKRNG